MTFDYAELARRPLEADQCALVVIDIQQKLLPPIFPKEKPRNARRRWWKCVPDNEHNHRQNVASSRENCLKILRSGKQKVEKVETKS